MRACHSSVRRRDVRPRRSPLIAGLPSNEGLERVRPAVRPPLPDRDAFFAEPSATGDQRWDAMLAANVEDLALMMGVEPPAWSKGHALPEFWFVGSMPELHAYAFAYSPFPMQVRGVMIDPAGLESV